MNTSKNVIKNDILMPAQIRAARAFLGWTQDRLAEASDLPKRTIARIELGEVSPRESTIDAIRAALENAGIEFIPEDGGGAGVRLRSSYSTDEFGPKRDMCAEALLREVVEKAGGTIEIEAGPFLAYDHALPKRAVAISVGLALIIRVADTKLAVAIADDIEKYAQACLQRHIEDHVRIKSGDIEVEAWGENAAHDSVASFKRAAESLGRSSQDRCD